MSYNFNLGNSSKASISATIRSSSMLCVINCYVSFIRHSFHSFVYFTILVFHIFIFFSLSLAQSSILFYASFEDHFLHPFTYCSHFVYYCILSPPCHFLARLLLPFTLFLGTFAKLRKATISFVMSVRPHGTT